MRKTLSLKFIALALSILLAGAMLVVGVLAVISHTVNVGTNVSFVATGVSGNINGQITSVTNGDSNATTYNASELTKVTYTESFTPATSSLTGWNIGELAFNVDNEGLTGIISLDFTVNNTGTNKMIVYFTTPEGSTDFVTNTNIGYKYVNGTNVGEGFTALSNAIFEVAAGGTLTFSVQVYVINEGLNIADTTNNINFVVNMSNGQDLPTASYTTPENLNTSTSTIPSIIKTGEDYVAVLNFNGAYSLNQSTTTVTLTDADGNDTTLNYGQFGWDASTSSLIIPAENLGDATAVTLNLGSVTFNNTDMTNAGTTTNPYQVNNANQLTLLSELVNNKNDQFSDLNYTLTNNIDLNPNITFEYDETHHLVVVTDGTSTIYIGSGMPLAENQNIFSHTDSTLAENKSVVGAYYELINGIYTQIENVSQLANKITITLSNEEQIVLNEWDAIGTYSKNENEEDNFFTGTVSNLEYNGNYSSITGVFINKPTTKGGWSIGLFGRGSYKLNNIVTGAGCVIGFNSMGGMCGSNSSDGYIKNCTNNIIMIGSTNNNGGIVGGMDSLIENCTNNAFVIGGGNSIGGIVGCSSNGNIIKNCVNNGNVYGYNSSSVAGVAGLIPSKTTIINCINNGNVMSSKSLTGGIAGGLYNKSNFNPQATIQNCINYGEIVSLREVGGIVGGVEYNNYDERYCNIHNCLNLGAVIGTGLYVGAITGEQLNDSEISGCYYLENCAKIGDVVQKGVGGADANSSYDTGTNVATYSKTDAELKQKATFVGWDFENVWQIEEGNSYPTLRNIAIS